MARKKKKWKWNEIPPLTLTYSILIAAAAPVIMKNKKKSIAIASIIFLLFHIFFLLCILPSPILSLLFIYIFLYGIISPRLYHMCVLYTFIKLCIDPYTPQKNSMYVISHYFSVRIIVKMVVELPVLKSLENKIIMWMCLHIKAKAKKWTEQRREFFHFIMWMWACCVTQKPSMWHKLERTKRKVCLLIFSSFSLSHLVLLTNFCRFFAYGLLSSPELPTRILLAILQTHILVINISFFSSTLCSVYFDLDVDYTWTFWVYMDVL